MTATGKTIKLEVFFADPLTFDGDAIVIPTNSEGRMSEGVAARAREIVGAAIEGEVGKHAPIAVGAAFVTPAEPLHVKYLIHVPLYETPGTRIGIENIRRATRASMLAADRYGLARIGMPGMGYGDLGVSHEEAARAMIDEVLVYKGENPQTIALLDLDEDMHDAFLMMAEQQ